MPRNVPTAAAAKLIGQVIRHYRRAGTLTQEELAAISGIDISFISRMERGLTAPSVPLFIQLAQALGTSASDLIAEIERQLAQREPHSSHKHRAKSSRAPIRR